MVRQCRTSVNLILERLKNPVGELSTKPARLERKLVLFKEYYNSDRVHRGLDGAPPDEKSGNTNRKIARLDDYRWQKRCRGLYQLPAAA